MAIRDSGRVERQRSFPDEMTELRNINVELVRENRALKFDLQRVKSPQQCGDGSATNTARE